MLTTSNITGAIDLAFIDRADIKAYIGPPSAAARYEMLRSCVAELTRVGIIDAPLLLPWRELQVKHGSALLLVARVAGTTKAWETARPGCTDRGGADRDNTQSGRSTVIGTRSGASRWCIASQPSRQSIGNVSSFRC